MCISPILKRLKLKGVKKLIEKKIDNQFLKNLRKWIKINDRSKV